jgi:hypothetical protein
MNDSKVMTGFEMEELLSKIREILECRSDFYTTVTVGDSHWRNDKLHFTVFRSSWQGDGNYCEEAWFITENGEIHSDDWGVYNTFEDFEKRWS